MEKHRYYCIGNIEKLQLFHIPPVHGLIPNFPEEKKGVQKGVTTPGSTGNTWSLPIPSRRWRTS